MKQYILSLGVVATLLLATPVSVEAFAATDTNAIQLTNTHALYTITYNLGHSKQSIMAPLFVREVGSTIGHPGNVASVQFSDPRATVTSAGIILSDAVVRDGEYFIPAGQRATFTLVMLAAAAEGSSIPTIMQVSELPFTFMSEEQILPNGLSAGELGSFKVQF